MKKQFITANNLQIACYVENPEKNETIFFIHGNSCSYRVWRKQAESPSLADYRLIAIDLPCHGNSDALPVDADYSMPAIAKILATVISEFLNNKPYIICGSSLGTNVVVEMLAFGLLPAGLVLAGAAIAGEGYGVNKIILEGADLTTMATENVPLESLSKYAGEAFVSKDEESTEIFLEDYHAVKGPFRSSLFATIAAGTYSDEIKLLQKSDCPVCIVFGKEEKIINTNYLNSAPVNLWNNTIYKIPGAGHLVNIDAPELFNELVAEFAKDVFTKDAA